jgi:peroxin-6
MLKAITRQARLVDAKVAAHNKNLRPGTNALTVAGFFDHYATDEDTEVVVSEEDFESARRELVPSVSYEELQHYERVRMTFEGNGSAKKDAEKPQIAISAGPPPTGNGNGIVTDKALPAPPVTKDSRRLSAAKLKGLREKTLNSLHRNRSQKSNAVADGASQDGSEDEYTIDTSHLANGNGKLVHKGKGKSRSALGGFGDAAGDDEELYS